MKKSNFDQLLGKELRGLSLSQADRYLRQLVRAVAREHYDRVHRPGQKFVPGQSYLRYAGRVYDDEEMANIMESGLDFWLTAGKYARDFEEKFGDFLGIKSVVLVNSGSSANLLALAALTSPQLIERQLKPGDEVITVAACFPTTINPILQLGMVPVFVDVELGTYNLNAADLEKAVTKKTKAVMLAHTLGNPYDAKAVASFCRQHSLWFIEDACDALGSEYAGKKVGTFGDLATFSFYPAHHITMGEGGAVVTDNPQLKRLLVSFRDWGRACWCEPGQDNSCGHRFEWKLAGIEGSYDHKYLYDHIGYNLKLTEMQAAIGVAQLKKLPGFIQKRKQNYQRIRKVFAPLTDRFLLPQALPKADPAWFAFPVTVRSEAKIDRNKLVNFLEDHRVATRLLFAGHALYQPAYQHIRFRQVGSLPNSKIVLERTFFIGVYPGIDVTQIAYLQKVVEMFLGGER